MEVVISN